VHPSCPWWFRFCLPRSQNLRANHEGHEGYTKVHEASHENGCEDGCEPQRKTVVWTDAPLFNSAQASNKASDGTHLTERGVIVKLLYALGRQAIAAIVCVIVLASMLAPRAAHAQASVARWQIRHQPAVLVNGSPVRDRPDSAIVVARPPTATPIVLIRLVLAHSPISRLRVTNSRLGLRSPPA